MWFVLPPLRTIAAVVLLTLAALGVGGLLFAWSGLYNIAASRGHWPIVNWFFEFAMRSSIRTYSLLIEPPRLSDPDLVKLGAGHFAGGCAPCHGAPGQPRNPITRQMLPEPTNLVEAVPTWGAKELFWIVKHGIKYSGMPAWTAPRRDDEVWAMVAFLQRLPAMKPEEYRSLARGNVRYTKLTAAEILRAGGTSSSLTACARCHGDAESPPTSQLVPRLAGQKQAYLERALRSYAAGQRPSGIMQPVAAPLDEEEIVQLSAYYAGLPRSTPQSGADNTRSPNADLIANGRSIATQGIAREGIPACLTCHNETSSILFPRLEGQHAAYMAGQLQLWKNGLRDRTVPGRIMATIARRLTADQIAAVAAYFESLSPAPAGAQDGASRGTPP